MRARESWRVENMSKDLVVYYSLESNTEYVASVLKEKIGTDLLKLVPRKAYHDKFNFTPLGIRFM